MYLCVNIVDAQSVSAAARTVLLSFKIENTLHTEMLHSQDLVGFMKELLNWFGVLVRCSLLRGCESLI